ncbi:Hypothetical protein NTJ_06419 [Nesidiocoris tenuis]|uniref:WW domain-containing protein n=1 Tax=Nesidiocoris tenuis TaxID=355587 RepID=A0ABN7AN00_9HEMI|nr:Hypothetical protein NTJ_06419 [Nesidiocoris tenuis]
MNTGPELSAKEPRLTWKSKYEQIKAVHGSNGAEDSEAPDVLEGTGPTAKTNGEMSKVTTASSENGQPVVQKSNVLAGLSGYLSSSDEDDDDSTDSDSDLNSEVDAFLKEIDDIYSERRTSLPAKETKLAPPEPQTAETPAASEKPQPAVQGPAAPTVAWQECYDSSTGYTYYWNFETNEVTWDMPIEYQLYLEAMKQWQQYQAQTEVAALIERAKAQQLQQQQELKQQQLLQQQQQFIQQAQEAANSAKLAEQAKAAKRARNQKKRKKRMSSSASSTVKKSDSEDDEKIELITSYGPNSGDESDSDQEPTVPSIPKVVEKPAPIPADVKRQRKLRKIIKDTARRQSSSEKSVVMGPQLPPVVAASGPKEVSGLVPYNADVDSDQDSDQLLSARLEKFVKEVSMETPAKKNEPPPPEEEDESALLERLRSQTQVLQELGGEVPEEIKSIITVKDGDLASLVPSYSEGSGDEEESWKAVKPEKKIKADMAGPAKLPKAAKLAIDQQFYEPEEATSPAPRVVSPENSADAVPFGKKRKLKLGVALRPKIEPHLAFPESGKDDFKGLGFSSPDTSIKKLKTDKIHFVKAETLQFSNSEPKAVASSADFDADDSTEPNLDVKDASGVLLDKMKFLSAAKEPVSPVQIWTVQLETLLGAWETQNLKTSYFQKWLTTITKELETLESTVAPDGWRCEWQRSEKCYSYRNVETQLVVWEFPQREDKPSCGGEEDMEVCTTPPPPPSPPRISVPSPPPPPNIDTPPLPSKTPPPPSLSSDLPPLPPLPPMPPPPPPDDPPPPPPPELNLNEPLPPGVDPTDVRTPPLPVPPAVPMVPGAMVPPMPIGAADYAMHVPMHAPIPIPMMPHQMHYPIAYSTAAVTPTTISAVPQPNAFPAVARHPESGHNLSTELDSFYSDIASLEPEPVPPPPPPKDPTPPPQPPPPSSPPPPPVSAPESTKKKKKTKLAPGLALKKKGVSSLVAKWQQVQEDVRRDMKHIDD